MYKMLQRVNNDSPYENLLISDMTECVANTSAAPIIPRHDTYPFLVAHTSSTALKGKVALITGAGRGIGFEISKALASAGASVACISRTKSELESAVKLLQEAYQVNAIGIAADVSGKDSPELVISEVTQRLGPIDILVNNAGVYRLNTLEHEKDFEDWWRVVEVNLRGPAAFTHAVLPQMIERKTGIIMSLGSRSAIQTAPFSTAYSASKAALLRFHRNLDREIYAHGICSYYVQPGDVPTTIAHAPGVINLDTASKVPALQQVLERSIGASTESPRLAAHTILWLCTAVDAHLLSGRYVDAEIDLETLMFNLQKSRDAQNNTA